MSWTYEPVFDAAHRAALESGNSIIYVCPPAPWAVQPLLQRLQPSAEAGIHTLVLAPDTSEALALFAETSVVEALNPAHAVTGLARASRSIKTGGFRTLIATPADAIQLTARSSLRLELARQVIICWPEAHVALDRGVVLDEILGQCGSAQRIVITADDVGVRDFTERHARRAPVLQATPPPDTPALPIRYAVVSANRVTTAARALLDAQNPHRTLIWDPSAWREHRWWEYQGDPSVRVGVDPGDDSVDLAIAVELPSAEALSALQAVAGDVVVFARPRQVPYLNTLTQRSSIVHLRSEVDAAQDWRTALRGRVRDRVEEQSYHGSLLALAPLFDEFDPALVAAALLELPGQDAASPSAVQEIPHWVHLHLGVGRRDQVRTGDIVGALLNAAGLSREQIGRVDMRETFTLVEVRAEAGETARRSLDGIVLRGRTVSARFDRK